MTRIIFDTNAYTLLKSKTPEDSIEILEFSDEIGIPIVIFGELHAGFYGGNKLKANLEEFENFLAVTNARVLNISIKTAKIYGELFVQLRTKGIAIPQNDLWIAALALEFDFIVYSFDKHFKWIDEISVIQSFDNLLDIMFKT
jgi:tRNA(fMet)-specific endonuclease VapC